MLLRQHKFDMAFWPFALALEQSWLDVTVHTAETEVMRNLGLFCVKSGLECVCNVRKS